MRVVEGDSERLSFDEVSRTARAMVEAYGHDAACLMRRRLAAVRRRGDHETALLWGAVAEAVDIRLHVRGRV